VPRNSAASNATTPTPSAIASAWVSRNTSKPVPPAVSAAPAVRPNMARSRLERIKKPKIANGSTFQFWVRRFCHVRSGGGSASPSINRII
jgi:hypothetical protein